MMEVPAAAKVLTTRYDNFKGVDLTNDPTNVWSHRSPSGVNMLPDTSGRPFKRHGWEIAKDSLGREISAGLFAEMLGISENEISINKCFYFELAGHDHIIVFSSGGVFCIKKIDGTEEDEGYGNEVTLLTDDADCYGNWDRAFFFEGGGKSAFYIYGSYKAWIYEWDEDGYSFSQVGYKYPEDESGIEIPVVLFACSPDCVGTPLQGYNLVGNMASCEYQGNDLFFAKCTGDLSVAADKSIFVQDDTDRGVYEYTYSSSTGEWDEDLEELGITILSGTPVNGDKIIVVYSFGVLLPNNVSQTQVSQCRCYITVGSQFDKEMDVLLDSDVPTQNAVVLHTDNASNDKAAWIEFDKLYTTESQEDVIKTIFPANEVIIQSYTNLPSSGGTTTLNW